MVATFEVLPWVFTQKGIDVLLGKMDISKANVDVPSTELDQDIADVTQAMANDSLSDSAGTKHGQIEIAVARVVIGKKIHPSSHWDHDEAKSEVEDDEDRTHEISYADEPSKQHTYASTVLTRPYRAVESFYTKVIVQYHDITKLIALKLCTRDGTPIDKGALPLPALPSSAESPSSPKRFRVTEAGPDDTAVDSSMSSDDESASSDPTSDSDVPRQKKRRAIPGIRKAKPRNRKNKALSWLGPKADEPSIQSMAVIE